LLITIVRAAALACAAIRHRSTPVGGFVRFPFSCFEGKLKKALSWLSGELKKLDELKLFLQNEIDKNKVYIENIEVQIKDQEKEHDKEKVINLYLELICCSANLRSSHIIEKLCQKYK
jgi:hypothetical protein